jgi:hypothetical protein
MLTHARELSAAAGVEGRRPWQRREGSRSSVDGSASVLQQSTGSRDRAHSPRPWQERAPIRATDQAVVLDGSAIFCPDGSGTSDATRSNPPKVENLLLPRSRFGGQLVEAAARLITLRELVPNLRHVLSSVETRRGNACRDVSVAALHRGASKLERRWSGGAGGHAQTLEHVATTRTTVAFSKTCAGAVAAMLVCTYGHRMAGPSSNGQNTWSDSTVVLHQNGVDRRAARIE